LYQYFQQQSGQTAYSYDIDSFYGGTHHDLYDVVVNALNEMRSL
jgi:hypothetical protein